MNLPSVESLTNETKGELAARLVHCTYDYALPQLWLDDVVQNLKQMSQHEFAASVVWAYPDGYLAGLPAPLTSEAAFQLRRLGVAYYED